jgi:glucokinase
MFALIGSLGGVGLGQWLAGRNLRQQLKHESGHREADRSHELELREMELRQEHRARLQSERLAAYKAFATAHLLLRRVDEDLRIWWSHRQLRGSETPIDTAAFDAANKRAMEEMARAGQARSRVEEAVAIVRLVSSQPVKDCAAAVLKAAADVSKAELALSSRWEPGGLAGGGPDEWAATRDARSRLADEERMLEVAISEELELNR